MAIEVMLTWGMPGNIVAAKELQNAMGNLLLKGNTLSV